jgi:hypothetical protein
MDLGEFLNWQFWVATLFVAAANWFTKLIVSQLSPGTIEKNGFKALLTLSNIAWGLVTAVPENYLRGDGFGERAMLGVCAGMASNFTYALFIKRILDRVGANPGEPGAVEALAKPADKPAAKAAAEARSERKTRPEIPVVEPPPGPGEQSGGP